jgi:hypothetical protein
MASFPGSRIHRVSRRQLGRGQRTNLGGGALASQGVEFTDLGFSYNQGTPSQSIYNAPTVSSGLLLVAALFDNTHTPVLTVTDAAGAHTPGPDNGPISVDADYVLVLYSQLVQAGRINVALSVVNPNTAVMAFRVGIVTGLSLNALVSASGAAAAGSPDSGSVAGTSPQQLFFGAIAGKQGSIQPTLLSGFVNVGIPLVFNVAGSLYMLQAGYQRVLQATSLTFRSPEYQSAYAASLAAYQ